MPYIHTKYRFNKKTKDLKINCIFDLFLFVLGMIVFFLVLVIVPANTTGGHEQCNETYYIIGKTTKFDDRTFKNKSLFYMVTEKELKPNEKISYYDYYYLPVDSFDVKYNKGDKIIMDHTNNMLKSVKYTNLRADISFIEFVFLILFITILVFMFIVSMVVTS